MQSENCEPLCYRSRHKWWLELGLALALAAVDPGSPSTQAPWPRGDGPVVYILTLSTLEYSVRGMQRKREKEEEKKKEKKSMTTHGLQELSRREHGRGS